jgi:fructokinase
MATTLEALVTALSDDVLVAIDPNCRPSTIDDPPAYRGRLGRLLGRADVVKASTDDLAWLNPSVDPVAAARGLLGSDHAIALVTLGGDGALVVTHADVIEIDAPAVDVVDTIGAGDAFMGAFLSRWQVRGLERGNLAQLDDVVDAARFACRVAAITCSRAGADPPRSNDL